MSPDTGQKSILRRIRPPPLLRRPEADLARLPIGLDLGALNLLEGLRAALSFSVVVAVNTWLQLPGMREAALAAWLTCLCDQGGPIRRRLPAVLSFAFIGALMSGTGGLVRAAGLPLMVPLATCTLFCLSFARIYGQSAMQVGNLLGVVLVLAVDRAQPNAWQGAALAGFFLAGGLWAALLTMVVWRLHPYQPARRSIANVYRQLMLMTADMRRLLTSGALHERAWEEHARAHRRAVREAIEQARSATMETVHNRGGGGPRAAQALIRLETGDQLFGALIALSDHVEHAASLQETAAADRLLRRLRPLLLLIWQSLLFDRPPPETRMMRLIAALTEDIGDLPASHPIFSIARAVAERLRIAVTLAVPANYLPQGRPAGRDTLWRRIRDPILANLTWHSLVLRHALRAAVVTGAALLVTSIWYGPDEHWLTITIVLTMQPNFALTVTRGLERIGGTVIGGAGAALIGLVCRTQIAMIAALFPLAIVAFAVRQVSFALFISLITPIVVLLAELGQPGASEVTVAAMRALYTLAGGLLALAGCFLLWPAWEPLRLEGEVRAAIAAHAAYADAVMGMMTGDGDADVERMRGSAGMASNNLEASLSRALLEPRRGAEDRLEAAMVIDAALRRIAGRLAAVQVDEGLAATMAPAAWREWRAWITASMKALAAGRTDLAARPQGGAEAVARLARPIELMPAALERLRSDAPPPGRGIPLLHRAG